MRRLLLLQWMLSLLLVLDPLPALAEWTRMEGNATTAIYIDMGAIRKSPQGRQTAFLMDRSTPDGEGVRSMIDVLPGTRLDVSLKSVCKAPLK